MAAIVFAVLAAWLVIWRAPATPVARRLRHHLVDRPAGRLSRITAGQIALAALFAAALGAATWFGGGDGVRVVGMAMPDVAMWLATAELTAYLDLAVAAVAACSVVRTRGVRDVLGSFRPVMVRRSRARARRNGGLVGRAGNDNEEGPARRAA